jgi:dipeptidyl-peptidase-4
MRFHHLFLALALPASLHAQRASLSVEGIFGRGEFASAPMPSLHWLKDGRSYVDTRAAAGGGTDVVKVDVVTGRETVLADAAALTVNGRRLDVEELVLSADESKALLFHGSVRVWRTNTRGVYHVLDFATKRLTPIVTSTSVRNAQSTDTDTSRAPFLGKQPSFLARGLASGAADPDLQMFAKFSPDGRMVAFVRANDLWVTDLATGRSRALTHDGTDDIINGTTDWVYEEELGLRDAFRWSPDSKRIAFWRFDQSRVPAFPMVNETAGQYPVVSVLRYPKAGAPNSRVRVGVLGVAGSAPPAWLAAGPDTGNYLARMEWAGNDSLVVTRLPRKQDVAELLMLSATSGRGRTMFADRDSAYVDVEGDELRWVNGGREFLWSSDRSGWRAIWLVGRDGRVVRQLTPDGMDVTALVGVDETRGAIYVQAAAPDPTQRQIYRYPLAGPTSAGERVTGERGSYALDIAPGAKWGVAIHSTIATPPTATLVELPSMREARVIEDNAELRSRLASAGMRAPEFFRLPNSSGTMLDAYRIAPASFDSTQRHPVLMYCYGGPAAPQVVDQWSGTRYLWHQMLAQEGVVVVVVDNRGAAWRGRDFRKATQYHLGRLESADQIDAARWIGQQPWGDPARIGLWGWSYGGYLTSLTAFRGGSVFAMAMAVAPVTDFRLYDSIYTERYMWTPAENAEGYAESAPQAHVKGLAARFLVVHGTGDDNVHPQNTIQLANALEAAGKPFWMLLYPNRTHSISGGNTSVHLFDQLTRFVRESLEGERAEGKRVEGSR